MTPPERLTPAETARLVEFARVCKAAVRAMSLYPAGHPAIAQTLSQIERLSDRIAAEQPIRLKVLPDGLLMDHKATARPDAAVSELAAMLHERLVSDLVVHGGAEIDVWRAFFSLLARSAIDLRAEGGLGRVWGKIGGRQIEIAELDYGEVLRERVQDGLAAAGDDRVSWRTILQEFLQSSSSDLSEEKLRALVELVSDPQRLEELTRLVGTQSTGVMTAQEQERSLARVFTGVIQAVQASHPEELNATLDKLTAALSHMPPEVVLELLDQRGTSKGSQSSSDAADALLQRMSDRTVADFVGQSVVANRGASARLAQAFQTLIPQEERQASVLELARGRVLTSQGVQTDELDALWGTVVQTLTSYSDAPFVSEAYGNELSRAQGEAREVERLSDDPPERVAAWLQTVADTAVRALDLQLLLDLLAVEPDPQRWRDLTEPIVAHIDDLLLLGDFDAAQALINALLAELAEGTDSTRRATAEAAIDRLVGGEMMRHIVSHLDTIDDEGFEQVRQFCHSLGPVVIRPLAETLATERRGRPLRRLTSLLLGFGAAGREAVEQLKASANPAVRRTAIRLLREFGGLEALPELAALVDDAESDVQKEAIEAILRMGSDAGHEVLRRALTSGTAHARVAIMRAVEGLRADEAAPALCYIARHVSHRGPLREIYLRAIELLGARGNTEAIEPLKQALYGGVWWAPFRTAELRAAAAGSLGRVGTPEAFAVLEEAAARGRRGVRAVARTQLARRGVASRLEKGSAQP